MTNQRLDHSKPETVVSSADISKPGGSEREPALPIQGLEPEPVTPKPDPSPGLESPVKAPEHLKLDDLNPGAISGHGPSKPETSNPTAPGAETTGPRVLKPEDLTQAPEEGASRSKVGVDRPIIQSPIVEAVPLSVKEAADRPDPISPSTISRKTESRPEGADAKSDAVGAKSGESTTQSPHSSPNSPENPAVAGWVKLPNTSKGMGTAGEDRFDAVGGVNRSVVGTRRDPRADADKEVIFEAESSRTQPKIRSGKSESETEDRLAPRPSNVESPPPGSKLPNESVASIESTRVEAVPHIVERDAEFLDHLATVLRIRTLLSGPVEGERPEVSSHRQLACQGCDYDSSCGGSRRSIHRSGTQPGGRRWIRNDRSRWWIRGGVRKPWFSPSTRLAPDDADHPDIRLVFGESDTGSPLQSDQRRARITHRRFRLDPGS